LHPRFFHNHVNVFVRQAGEGQDGEESIQNFYLGKNDELVWEASIITTGYGCFVARWIGAMAALALSSRDIDRSHSVLRMCFA
jgi:hypothetical protein